MSRLIALLALAVLVGFGVWSLLDRERHEPGWGLVEEREGKEEEEGDGPMPSPWFLLQRTWPDAGIEPVDYLAAARQAERLADRQASD